MKGFTPLQTKLLARIDASNFETIQKVIGPIKKEFFDEYIYPTPRLYNKIAREVLKRKGIDLEGENTRFPKEHVLQELIDEPSSSVTLGLGLAWHACRLRRAMFAEKSLRLKLLKDIHQAEIRFALHFKTEETEDTGALPTRAQLEDEGCFLFHKWISDIPHSTKELLIYSYLNGETPNGSYSVEPIQLEFIDTWIQKRVRQRLDHLPSKAS